MARKSARKKSLPAKAAGDEQGKLPGSLPKGHHLTVCCETGGDTGVAMAEAILRPAYSAAHTIASLEKTHFCGHYSLMANIKTLQEQSKRLNEGDMSNVEAMLFAQACALNLIFSEMSTRAFRNFGGEGNYLEAGKQYFSMAMKAQSQCRASLEAIGYIKNPSAVIARQANINHGGQQQVNNALQPTRVGENETPQSKKLERTNEQRMDAGTAAETGPGDPELAAVGQGNRSENT
jgi:hypothetical protein